MSNKFEYINRLIREINEEIESDAIEDCISIKWLNTSLLCNVIQDAIIPEFQISQEECAALKVQVNDLNMRLLRLRMKVDSGEESLSFEVIENCENIFQPILNKINRITSNHRHGRNINESDLDSLSNAQLDYEETIRNLKTDT